MAQEKISVIIPLMPIEPYKTQIDVTIEGLKNQTVDPEIIVSEQPVEKFINKARLLNRGFERSTGDIIFHCDADVIFKDPTLLERMRNKLNEGWDVIYPCFYSTFRKNGKIADGHPFMWRSVKEEYGPANEEHLGISLQEFDILYWLLKNKKFYCTKEFYFHINEKPFVKKAGKAHRSTRIKCRDTYEKAVVILKGMGVWV